MRFAAHERERTVAGWLAAAGRARLCGIYSGCCCVPSFRHPQPASRIRPKSPIPSWKIPGRSSSPAAFRPLSLSDFWPTARRPTIRRRRWRVFRGSNTSPTAYVYVWIYICTRGGWRWKMFRSRVQRTNKGIWEG